jgi:hypothetical protein
MRSAAFTLLFVILCLVLLTFGWLIEAVLGPWGVAIFILLLLLVRCRLMRPRR